MRLIIAIQTTYSLITQTIAKNKTDTANAVPEKTTFSTLREESAFFFATETEDATMLTPMKGVFIFLFENSVTIFQSLRKILYNNITFFSICQAFLQKYVPFGPRFSTL